MHKSKGGKTLKNQEIINAYLEEFDTDDFDMREVARWAIRTGRWEFKEVDPIKVCAKELSRAAREEYYVDPQGRDVRKKHCFITDADGQRRWHWVDIVNAQPEKIHLAMQQRRQGCLRDVVQLKTDLDSYNENNPYGAQLEMNFNFDEDLDEMEQPDEYPEGPEASH